jgi:hypothetical protein
MESFHLGLSHMGSEAALTLAAMEACRHEAMLKLTALDARRAKIAFDFCTTNNAVALQKWRSMDDEAARLVERITLFDHAIIEARQRAMNPDWREQYKQITKTEIA